MKTVEETVKGVFERCSYVKPWDEYNFKYISHGGKGSIERLKEAKPLKMEDGTYSSYLLELGLSNLITLQVSGSLLKQPGVHRRDLAQSASTFGWRRFSSRPPHLMRDGTVGVYLWEIAAIATPMELALICDTLYPNPVWVQSAFAVQSSLIS